MTHPDRREDLESRSPNLGPYTTKGTLQEPPLRDLLFGSSRGSGHTSKETPQTPQPPPSGPKHEALHLRHCTLLLQQLECSTPRPKQGPSIANRRARNATTPLNLHNPLKPNLEAQTDRINGEDRPNQDTTKDPRLPKSQGPCDAFFKSSAGRTAQ